MEVPVPTPIEVPAPLLTPVEAPELQGETVDAVGVFIAAQDQALREANGRITATCRIVERHNEEAGAASAECE